jgi:hypothetical protein
MADMNDMDLCIAVAYDQEATILGTTSCPDASDPWHWSQVDWAESLAKLDANAVKIILCLAGLPDPPDGSRIIVNVDVAAGTVEIS